MTKQLQCFYECNIALVRTVIRQLAIGSVEDRSRKSHIIISEITPRCEILGFLRGVLDVFELLGCSRCRLAVGYRSYRITLSVSFSLPWPFKIGLIHCPETSITNHQPRRRCILVGRRHQLLLDLIMGIQNTTFCRKNANQRQILVNCPFGGPWNEAPRGLRGSYVRHW